MYVIVAMQLHEHPGTDNTFINIIQYNFVFLQYTFWCLAKNIIPLVITLFIVMDVFLMLIHDSYFLAIITVTPNSLISLRT